jgi:hypothetical protein
MSGFGDAFRLTLLTADPAWAAAAEAAGVQRIGVDLERLGKAERQAGYNTRLSEHRWDDLSAVARTLRRANAFARLNPLHDGSATEVETALACGARVLMLPFFKTAIEVERFVGLVRGRAEVMALVETAPALLRIREIIAVPGVDEIMLGLNDLRLQFGTANHFEVLVSPVIDGVCDVLRTDGRPFSIGGVARSGDAAMPVPSELVYAQYPRLGATGGWVARSFLTGLAVGDLAGALSVLRRKLSDWAMKDAGALEAARGDLARRAAVWGQSASRVTVGEARAR